MLTKNHDQLTIEVAEHIKADAIVAGHYWNEQEHTGCFIGCLTHSNNAQAVTDRFGFPLPLVKICENIFEALPAEEGKEFFAAIPDAVGSDGKDLSRVHWAFLAAELRALPAVPSHIQDVIDPVIAGMDLMAGGDDWHDAADAAYAAYAAARAADAAYAAYAAAHAARAVDAARAAALATADAARAAARAVDAARAAALATADAARAAARVADAADAADAARIRQRDTLLALIAAAPIAAE